jgi:hypothetical protein
MPDGTPWQEYIERVAEGSQMRVQGLKVGTVKVTVHYEESNNGTLTALAEPVTLHVRVSNEDANPVYLTTAQNIVAVVQGQSMNLQVELVNGTGAMLAGIVWDTSAPNIINIQGAGQYAVVQGRTPGIARVRVSHVTTSVVPLEMIVIVEPDSSQAGIYIATDTTLVEMRPGEMSRRIGVRLVGGKPEDVYGFLWEKISENSLERESDGTSRLVIDLVPGTDAAYISAHREGDATIRVSHPKTNYKLDIRVNVREFTKIEFSKRDLRIDMGKMETVNITAPTGMRVFYEVIKVSGTEETVLTVNGTNRVAVIEAVSAGTAIIRAFNATHTLSDEIMVIVNFVNNVKVQYIEVPTTILDMYITDFSIDMTAQVRGVHDDGTPFENEDSSYIKWRVENTGGGQDIISLEGITGTDGWIIGERVIIKPLKPGTCEIHLTHDDINGGNYRKRMHVRVNDQNVNFSLDKYVMMMMPGDIMPIQALLTNTNDIRYEDQVRWYMEPDNGIAHVVPMDGQRKGMVTALKPGQVQVVAEYGYPEVRDDNINVTRRCWIYVQEPKTLEVMPNDQMDLLWNQVEELTYTVTPVPDSVSVTVDNNWLIRFVHDAEEKKITITALRGEVGTTQMRIVANGITKTVSIRVHKDYEFQWVENAQLRGMPYMGSFNNINGGPYVVKYRISPVRPNGEGYPVHIVTEATQGWLGFESANNSVPDRSEDRVFVASVNPEKMEVTIQPLRAGYGKITLITDTDLLPENKTLELPIFLYYTNIDYTFGIKESSKESRNGSRQFHSRFHETQNILYIADGESFEIEPIVDETVYYPGKHGLRLADYSNTSATGHGLSHNQDVVNYLPAHLKNGSTINAVNIYRTLIEQHNRPPEFYYFSNLHGIRVIGNGVSNPIVTQGDDYVTNQHYLGTIKLPIFSWNGRNMETRREQIYIVYFEEYARRP